MPFRARRVDPGLVCSLQVRVPGWVKNRVVEQAELEGLSVQAWVANVLFGAVERARGVAAPPPAVAALPTVGSQLRAYLAGEVLLEPCGRVSPCERSGLFSVDSVSYCVECNVRVL